MSFFLHSVISEYPNWVPAKVDPIFIYSSFFPNHNFKITMTRYTSRYISRMCSLLTGVAMWVALALLPISLYALTQKNSSTTNGEETSTCLTVAPMQQQMESLTSRFIASSTCSNPPIENLDYNKLSSSILTPTNTTMYGQLYDVGHSILLVSASPLYLKVNPSNRISFQTPISSNTSKTVSNYLSSPACLIPASTIHLTEPLSLSPGITAINPTYSLFPTSMNSISRITPIYQNLISIENPSLTPSLWLNLNPRPEELNNFTSPTTNI